MKLADKYIPASEYYNYQAPKEKLESVSQVIDRVYEEKESFITNVDAMEERLAVGGERLSASGGAGYLHDKSSAGNQGDMITSSDDKGVRTNNALADTVASGSGIYKIRQSAKERFYAKADYVRSRKQSVISNISKEDMREVWDNESRLLRKEAAYKAESIACDLLGEPNKRLSSRRELRFGEHGKIAVKISGERSGTWYDFSAEKGGDMFDLVQERRKCDFRRAAEYLRSAVGMDKSVNTGAHLQLVYDHENSDLLEKHIKAKKLEEREAKAKALQVEKLYARARDIGNLTVAYKYLTGHRGLNLNGARSVSALGDDIRTAGIYVKDTNDISTNNKGKGRYLPALIAFARDRDGNITGGQHLVLNKDSGYKADIAVPKKSFGKIAGSFVDLGNISYIEGAVKSRGNEVKTSVKNGVIADKAGEITIIAEGLETGLSVKQGLSEHSDKKDAICQTLCSLGISNIRNYEPYQGERIIIAADNDGFVA